MAITISRHACSHKTCSWFCKGDLKGEGEGRKVTLLSVSDIRINECGRTCTHLFWLSYEQQVSRPGGSQKQEHVRGSWSGRFSIKSKLNNLWKDSLLWSIIVLYSRCWVHGDCTTMHLDAIEWGSSHFQVLKFWNISSVTRKYVVWMLNFHNRRIKCFSLEDLWYSVIDTRFFVKANGKTIWRLKHEYNIP
jgi:hypothetical protein